MNCPVDVQSDMHTAILSVRDQHDLASCAGFHDRLMRTRGLTQRHLAADHRFERTVPEPGDDRRVDLRQIVIAWARANCTAAMPTPPVAPCTNTVSDGRAPPR